MKKLLFPLTFLSLLCFFVSIGLGQLTSTEIQQFLDSHNNYRSTVQPTAANMRKMVWNTQVAAKAQAYADSISTWENGHSTSTYRTYNDGVVNGYHGENL